MSKQYATLEEALIADLDRAPVSRQAYADYLTEQGRQAEADVVRAADPGRKVKCVADLRGFVLQNVEVRRNSNDDQVVFTVSVGSRVREFRLYHSQNCCESVDIEDVCGDVNDLIGVPLWLAEESVSENVNPDGVTRERQDESFTWTFYRFATVRGAVTIRWYGSSNGYYSERVDFEEVL